MHYRPATMIAVHRLRNITLAVAGVATATAVSKSAGFNASTAGFVFLLVVLFSATGGGVWPGVTASVLATACFNYFFLPPIGTFHIAGSADWAALAAFLTVAIVASRLVTRAGQQAARAAQRATEVETLYGLSIELFVSAANDEHTFLVAARALERMGVRAGGVVIFSAAGGDEIGAWTGVTPELSVRQRARSLRVHRQPLEFPSGRARDFFIPFGLDEEPRGAVVALDTVATRAAVESVARLLTLALERELLLSQRAHFEALRESEAMRTALLRAVSHDLSTPLTAMTLTVAGLQRQLVGHGAAASVDALSHELARLRRRIDNLLSMARLETGNVLPRSEPLPPPDLFRAVRENLGTIGLARRFDVRIDADCPDMLADPSLALEIVVNLVQNAHAASPPEAALELLARHDVDRGMVRVGVLDRGRGLGGETMARDPDDLDPRGLGLQIARRFAAAMGGDVTLAARPGGGTCAWLDLPEAAVHSES